MTGKPLDVLGAMGWGTVDAQGAVSPGDGKWELDWWVRSADRWHRAFQETAVRQFEDGVGAVVETKMKVPDGDAVHRVWAVASGGGSAAAVVEVANDSPVAVAVALTVSAPGVTLSVSTQGVKAGRNVVMAWDRPPAQAALGSGAFETVMAGEAGTDLDIRGRDTAVLVWPLPHKARMAVTAGLGPGQPMPPSDLPDADAVVRGWQAHLDRGARIEVPDEGLAKRIDRNRRRWLGLTGRVETQDTAELCQLAVRLDHHGYHHDAGVVLDEIADRWTTEAPSERLAAFGTHHDLTRDADGAVRYTEAVAEAIEAALRAKVGVPVESVERLLAAAGQERAVRDLRQTDLFLGGSRLFDFQKAGLRAELIDDHGRDLDLVPGFRSAWLGGSLAAYELPTRFGPVSFAVRWHGERPALLWELDLHSEERPVAIRASGLDAQWSSELLTGETLLAAPQPLP